MRFRDLPPIYARLAGFVAGSISHRLCQLVPSEVCRSVRDVKRPVDQMAWQLTPEPIKAGWELALSRPAEDEPPVLLIPGFLGPSILLRPLQAFLALHGRHVKVVHTFPALGGVVYHAECIARAVEQLRAKTGAAQVDIVTHSMGGLAGRYYLLKMGGRPFVRRFITVATPHKGTVWAYLHLSQSLQDMKPGNPLLEELAGAEKIQGVNCVNIRAGWDQIVWPREHGLWGEDRANEHELPWAEHWAVQTDPRLLALVLTLLEVKDDAAVQQEAAQFEQEASGA